MSKGKQSRNFDQKNDSDIAKQVASEHGLSAIVKDSRVVHPKTEQSQESDQQFLKKLAERNGYELFVFDKSLYFQPPSNDKAAVVVLEWGKGLVSFAPEINISEQVTTVEVRGWDVAQKKEFVGKAKQGDEPGRDGDGRSGAEVLKSVCREGGELKVRMPVFSQSEADQVAKAILKKRSEMFVSGSGESIGLPEIKADSNIELRGLGKLFSRTYYVQQATHTISTGGYRTTFKVKDTTI
jgi:phage protein D